MARRLLPLLAWGLLLAIALVTLAPIDMRPNSTMPANIERFAAFGAVGFAFAIAYPRRLLLIGAVVFGAAVGFELLQVLASTRHARLGDMVFKLLGGGLGIGFGLFVTLLFTRNRRTQLPSGPSSSQAS